MKRLLRVALILLPALGGLAAAIAWLNLRGEEPPDAAALAITPALVERGAYLARAGNCAGCHTARGGAPYAGGRAIETPFGAVYSSNLTPDATGLGGWSAWEFRRALRHGRSKDGRLLVPAFPYPNYTELARDDADALHAYLQSLTPVAQANRPHGLRFPYDTQLALAVWRALFFAPGAPPPEAGRSPEWQRGAYLVRGLGHCTACHTPRNALGGSSTASELAGGLIPVQNWYAPSLLSPDEAGVAHWSADEVVELLKTGRNARASVSGPMAEVVARSTQYLDDADLRAMAVFLQSLPPAPVRRVEAAARPDATTLQQGTALYDKHCSDCHGAAGEGAPGIAPALAGNRAVTMDPPVNLLRSILEGGYAPSTAGNPRPHGMPPFAQTLDDREIAALASTLRASWGHAAAPVSALQALQARQRTAR